MTMLQGTTVQELNHDYLDLFTFTDGGHGCGIESSWIKIADANDLWVYPDALFQITNIDSNLADPASRAGSISIVPTYVHYF
jgi:hypothetical protein